jgi:hypothetical protein
MANIPFLQCCDKNCFDDIKTFVGTTNYTLLRDKGLLEYGTIYGGSFFCKILDFKDSVSMSVTDFMGLLDRILDKGLVISCKNNLTTFASVETYLKYAEAVGSSTTCSGIPA